jgi:predicted flap endonuclease-1-like 5' DNA nuclease
MTFFLCKLWPYLAGGLIGWLLAGWFARRLKHSQVVEKVVEKEVERVVDNPEHLSLIGKLEKENSKIPELVTKIAGFQSGGGKTVTVDNPKLLAKIKTLEEENGKIAGLRTKLTAFENTEPQVIEKQVEKVVEVDSPELLARLKMLEEENGKISTLQSKLTAFENAEPQVVEKEVEKIVEVDNPELLARIKTLEEDNAQIATLRSKLTALEGAEPVVVEKTVEKLVDNPEHLSKISALEGQLAVYKRGPIIDVKAAKAAGIAIKNENDLTAIEGIGPKINDLIKADGIQTFAALSNTDASVIQKTLDNAGSKYQMANPGTWPDQANLAANNRWPALKALQDVLIGGVYPDASKSGASAKGSNSSTVAKSSKATPVVVLDISAAKEAGFVVRQKNGQDDFTLIEGVGPKINELIHADGIHTFTDLAETKVERIQGILDKAGSRYSLANPGTWPAQSDMAASNRWKDLKAWQDELDGGR